MSTPLLPKAEMVTEMCKRVNLPLAVGNRIMAKALEWSIISGQPFNMVLVARGISYAAKNKHLLKRNY